MAATVKQERREKILHGSKCERCGQVSFPATAVCPTCGPKHFGDMKPTELPTEGKVVAWTKLQVAPKGFPSPLIHCVVDLGAVKIIGTVQGAVEVHAGDRMLIVEDPTGRFPFAFSRLG